MFKKTFISIFLLSLIVLLLDFDYGNEVEYYNYGNFDYDKSAYLERFINSVEDVVVLKPDYLGNEPKILVSPVLDNGLIKGLLDKKAYALIINPIYGDFSESLNLSYSLGNSNYIAFSYNDSFFYEGFEIEHSYLIGEKVENIAYLSDGISNVPYVQKYGNIIIISDFNIGEISSKLLERLLNEFVFDIYKPFESIIIFDVSNVDLISCMGNFDYKSAFTVSPFIDKDIGILKNNFKSYYKSDYLIKIDGTLSPRQFQQMVDFGRELNNFGIKFIGVMTENLQMSEEHDNSIVPLYIEKTDFELNLFEYGRSINDENIVKVSTYEEYQEWLSNNYISLLLSKDSRIFIFPDENLSELDIVKIIELNNSLNIENGNFKEFEIDDYDTINENFGQSYVHEFVFNFSRVLVGILVFVIVGFLIIVLVLRNRNINKLFRQ
jgi:hypothetical protein